MVCVNIDIMKTFFTLGYMSEYLPVGLALVRFLLMSDHQPVECEENAALGFDMSISGHTHGGQMWPVPLLYNAMGILNYGEYHFDQMTHITSSGFTGWGWPVRNAYYCEYVVVDIQPAS